ncbi:MAG TPA: hypothetical protein VF167_00965 [Longimicrobiaceae bacterium]
MRRSLLLAVPLLFVAVAGEAQAQDWRPPSSQMPMMPRSSEIRGDDWLGSRSEWFRGLDRVAGVAASGLRASGEPRGGSEFVQVARFTSGPLPVVVWSDRNGDNRADIIEIFRGGSVVVQLIDADYDGNANVIRTYDASGELINQERF